MLRVPTHLMRWFSCLVLSLACCSRDGEEEGDLSSSIVRLPLRTELTPEAQAKAARPQDDYFDFAGDDAQGWKLPEDGGVLARGGEIVFAGKLDAGAAQEIARDMVFETHDADEMRLRARGKGKLTISWTAMLSEEAFPDSFEIDVDGDQTVLVPFAGRPGWRGMMRQISIRVADREGPLAIDDISLGKKARLAALEAAPDDLQFLGPQGRRGRPLTVDRSLHAAPGALQEGDRIRLSFGVPEESVGGGALRIVVKGAGVEQPFALERKLGWVDREIVVGAGGAADGDLEFTLEAQQRDLVFVGEPVVLRGAPQDIRSVVLITVGSLRADALGCSDTPLKTTTTSIDALAGYGLLMENVTTASNAAGPAIASILTSLYPKDHGVVADGERLGADMTTLAEIFRANGYATMAAVGSGQLGAGADGFGQGFDAYFAGNRVADRPAAAVNADVVPWLEAHRDRPLFAWVHYADLDPPHTPPAMYATSYYEGDPRDPKLPGLPFPTDDPAYAFLAGTRDVRYGIALYRGEVTALDVDVNKLLTRVHSLGLWNRAAIFLVGDRGESLAEHGIYFSEDGLFGETVLVPWILKLPQQEPRRSTVAAETIDIAPTALEFAGIEVPEGMRGTSRLTVATEKLDPAATQITDANVEEMAPTGPLVQSKRWFQAGGNVSVGLRADRFHAILNREHPRGLANVPAGVELYDLLMDRRMTKNVAAERREIADAMAAEIRAWLADRSVTRAGP